MAARKIIFSHHYPKLYGQTSAKLLAVETVTKAKLHPDFLEYDTTFEGGHYPLPNGYLLVLTFQGNLLIPFTTVRPASAAKFVYYESLIHQMFDIVILEGKEEDAAPTTQTALPL